MDNEVKMKVKDRKEISKTLDRFHYLLHDQTSPIISNFLSLGQEHSVEADSEKMISLMEQLNQMGSGMESISIEIQTAVEAQQKAFEENKQVRQQKVQKMVDQKVKETYENFKQT